MPGDCDGSAVEPPTSFETISSACPVTADAERAPSAAARGAGQPPPPVDKYSLSELIALEDVYKTLVEVATRARGSQVFAADEVVKSASAALDEIRLALTARRLTKPILLVISEDAGL